MAYPFNLQRLETTGEPIAIAERIPAYVQPLRAALFSVSDAGVLVYPEIGAYVSLPQQS
jgi:hypothetical protein